MRGELGGVGRDGTLMIFKFCSQFRLVRSTSMGGELFILFVCFLISNILFVRRDQCCGSRVHLGLVDQQFMVGSSYSI